MGGVAIDPDTGEVVTRFSPPREAVGRSRGLSGVEGIAFLRDSRNDQTVALSKVVDASDGTRASSVRAVNAVGMDALGAEVTGSVWSDWHEETGQRVALSGRRTVDELGIVQPRPGETSDDPDREGPDVAIHPPDPNDLAAVVLAAVAGAAGTTAGELRSDLELIELGLDSLDFWEILMQVEDATDADVPAEVLDTLTQLDEAATVGDLVATLSAWNPSVGVLPAGMTEPVIVGDADDVPSPI